MGGAVSGARAGTRFVPEVPHARVQLNDVRLDAAALLPGDGYQAYVQPFRSIADMHVTLAQAQAQALYDEAGALWAAAGDDPAARRWQRDAALFAVASAARAQRALRAWQRLQS